MFTIGKHAIGPCTVYAGTNAADSPAGIRLLRRPYRRRRSVWLPTAPGGLLFSNVASGFRIMAFSAHAHTHARTHVRACTCARTCARARVCARTHARACPRLCPRPCLHPRPRPRPHLCPRPRPCLHPHLCPRPCPCVRVRACARARAAHPRLRPYPRPRPRLCLNNRYKNNICRFWGRTCIRFSENAYILV